MFLSAQGPGTPITPMHADNVKTMITLIMMKDKAGETVMLEGKSKLKKDSQMKVQTKTLSFMRFMQEGVW